MIIMGYQMEGYLLVEAFRILQRIALLSYGLSEDHVISDVDSSPRGNLI
jgi:hypothetical protein